MSDAPDAPDDPMMIAHVGGERQLLMMPIPEDAERAIARVFTAHSDELDRALAPWGIRARDLLAPAWSVAVRRSMLEESSDGAPRHDHERVTIDEARDELADLGIDYLVEDDAPPSRDRGAPSRAAAEGIAAGLSLRHGPASGADYNAPMHPLCGTVHPDDEECPADV